MRSDLKHSKCGGSLYMVLPETAFFCLSPRIGTSETYASLGEIGKYDGSGKITIINESTSFKPEWICTGCNSVIAEKDEDEIVAICKSCGEEVQAPKALTTRGYSCICPDCIERVKDESDSNKLRKDPNSVFSHYNRKRSSTYSPTRFIEAMFNEVKLRRQ